MVAENQAIDLNENNARYRALQPEILDRRVKHRARRKTSKSIRPGSTKNLETSKNMDSTPMADTEYVRIRQSKHPGW